MMRRLTRRQALIGGAAATGLAAAGSVVGLSRGGRTHSTAAPEPSPSVLSSPTTVMPSPTRAPSGGIARLIAPDSFNFDTFDAQRAGDPTVVEVLGRTHSRLVTWTGFPSATLAPDLAMAWEQPDHTTLVFHLDPAGRWQDRPPLSGRALVAADVVAHIERMRALADAGPLPSAQLARGYASIQSVTAPDSATVVFQTSRPDPLLLDALASRFALVQAVEAVAAFEASWAELLPEQVIGTGSFTYLGESGGVLKFAANSDSHRPPLLDGLEVGGPSGDVDSFLARSVDELLTRDRRDAADVRARAGASVLELSRFEEAPVISSFSTQSPPWNNPRLIIALSAALNRAALAAALFAGRATACAPVSPATPQFAPTEALLAGIPGYGADAAADAATARALWESAGGPALGTVTIDFPSIFDPLYSASSIVPELLRRALGNTFRPAVETYTTIAKKAADGHYGNGAAAFWFGWAPNLISPDPTREFLETYDGRVAGGAPPSQATAAPFDAAAAEFDFARRSAAVQAASLAILRDGSAVLPWLLQRSELFRWPYLHASWPAPLWTSQMDVEASMESGKRALP